MLDIFSELTLVKFRSKSFHKTSALQLDTIVRTVFLSTVPILLYEHTVLEGEGRGKEVRAEAEAGCARARIVRQFFPVVESSGLR